jgi:murein hydrolase activator
MMNSFHLLLIVIVLAGAGYPGLPVGAESASSDKTKEFERIQEEMQEKQKEIKRASRKERSVLADLDKIDREIQTGSAELADHQKNLIEAEFSLHEIEKNSGDLGRKLTGLKQLYGQRVRALYKMHGNNSPVFEMDSLDGMARQIKYLGLIAERDNRIITDYQSALNRLVEQQNRTARKKSEILDQRRSVETKKSELEAKRLRKSAILASVRQEKSLSSQAMHELEEASVNLWAMIRKDEQERRSAKEAPAPLRHHENAPSGKTGGLPWPIDGAVLTRFGMQRHPQFGTMVFRRGIEIEAREGQSVRAVEKGEVAYADWYKGFGKLMILDHGNGFYSLYGNLSRLDFAKGDRVSKGQLIGLAGETGSLKGAKLYFEIRRDGEAQDPLRWLARR